MENKKNIIIILLVIVIAILSGVIVYSKIVDKEETLNEEQLSEEVTPQMLYGTYTWEKAYTTEDGKQLDLKLKLVLNSDGTAIYNASNGYEEEATKGKFVYEDSKIIYTREYYNYNDSNEIYNDTNNKIEKFEVIDKDTLKNVYYGQSTSLTK